MKFKVGDKVKCINNEILDGNDYGPPKDKIIVGNEYEIEMIVEDSQGNQHLDVGVKSMYNYIRSYETKEHLLGGDKVQWCHPSRFELV